MSVKQRKTMNSSYFSTPPVVKNLIIINCLAFLGVWLIPSLNQFMGQYGVLYWFGSPYYHSYQFVTYMFLHASLEHLFSICSHCGCSAVRWNTRSARSAF